MTPGQPRPTWKQRALRWLKPAILAALSASLLIHLVIAILAALIAFGGGGPGRPEGARDVEFAVVTEQELAELVEAALATDVAAAPEVDLEPQIDSVEAPTAEELATILEPEVAAETAAGGGDIGLGPGLGITGGGGGGASFFGVEATGTRFAYIVDVSGSMGAQMAGGTRLEVLQRELSESIEELLEAASFIVVPYSSGAYPLGGRDTWTDASDSGKRWARLAISKLAPGGSTIPAPAFELVFRTRPRPDAIYFMTDGEFDEELTDQLLTLNGEDHIPIHCISFGLLDSPELKRIEVVMKRIANQSGGTYTNVPGPRP